MVEQYMHTYLAVVDTIIYSIPLTLSHDIKSESQSHLFSVFTHTNSKVLSSTALNRIILDLREPLHWLML